MEGRQTADHPGEMSRYITRADKPLYVETPLWDDQREGLRPNLLVDDAKVVDTGLIDRHGAAILRVQDAIGFHRK